MDNLRTLQLTELAILKDTLQILQRNGISYYALGGTMLGAVRHRGFVPWDDDIDIGIPREDYERLLTLRDQFPEHLKLTFYPEDPAYPYYILRIIDSRIIVRSDRTEIDEVTPAWIDVFPLDGLPNRRLPKWIHEKSILFSRMLFQISRFDEVVNTQRSNRPASEKAIIWAAKRFHLQKLLSKERAFRILDRTLRRCPYNGSDYNVNAMGAYKLREAFDKRVFGNGALYDFEDMQIRGPADYETYLTQLYGDWRTPADFSHHSVVEITLSPDSSK